MTVGEAVRRRILALCEERSITINRLSILSGVTQSTLNNIMSGRNHTTTVATVKKLCDGVVSLDMTAQGTGVDSFNVSVAAGIILYEIQSQRAAQG